MRAYKVMYKVKAYGFITVEADSIDDALERASWEPFKCGLQLDSAVPINVQTPDGAFVVLDATENKSEKGTVDENKRAD